MLREARTPIECAYGRLKARWGILNEKIEFKLESIPTIILRILDLFQNQQIFQRNIQNSQENLPDKICSGNTTEGIHVRNLLTEYNSQSLLDCY